MLRQIPTTPTSLVLAPGAGNEQADPNRFDPDARPEPIQSGFIVVLAGLTGTRGVVSVADATETRNGQ